MKVVHIHRQSRAGAFSIERLFHAIAVELRNSTELVEYETGSRKSMFIDVWRLRKMNADIYHVTGDINYIVFFLPWKKSVLTVHDIGHFLFGLRGLRRWFYRWIWLYWPIKVARSVTAVSKATKDDIVNYLRIPENSITTIDNCYSELFHFVPRAFNSEYPVILQIGTKPYKNVPRLIRALQHIPCKLVLVGELDASIEKALSECNTDYVNRVNLTSEQIIQEYAECDIVAFVSTGEGFGLPIIEAQVTGRPIITANIPPMSEVAGEGACKVSPKEVSEIRDGILRIIKDEVYRNHIIEAGVNNASRFSPQAISNSYLDVYRQIGAP